METLRKIETIERDVKRRSRTNNTTIEKFREAAVLRAIRVFECKIRAGKQLTFIEFMIRTWSCHEHQPITQIQRVTLTVALIFRNGMPRYTDRVSTHTSVWSRGFASFRSCDYHHEFLFDTRTNSSFDDFVRFCSRRRKCSKKRSAGQRPFEESNKWILSQGLKEVDQTNLIHRRETFKSERLMFVSCEAVSSHGTSQALNAVNSYVVFEREAREF